MSAAVMFVPLSLNVSEMVTAVATTAMTFDMFVAAFASVAGFAAVRLPFSVSMNLSMTALMTAA